MARHGNHRTAWAFLAFAALLPAFAFVACEMLTLYTSSSWPFMMEILIFLWLAFYFVVAALSVVLVCIPKSRAVGAGALAFCTASIFAGWGGQWLAGELRVYEMSRLAARSAPVVAAIHSFEKDAERPPTSLSELTPRYLPVEPRTGLGGYPHYAYDVDEKMKWTLKVDTPTRALFNMDNLKYAPNRPISPSEGIARYGDWIYVEYQE